MFREATTIPGVLRTHGIRVDTREADLRVPFNFDSASVLASSLEIIVPSFCFLPISSESVKSFL